jgi:hypothetical protein
LLLSVGEGGFEPPHERRSRVGVKRLGSGGPSPLEEWARGDLNPHTLNAHWLLKPACLPFHHSPGGDAPL